jgi:hypothetical protein
LSAQNLSALSCSLPTICDIARLICLMCGLLWAFGTLYRPCIPFFASQSGSAAR